jgi:hypothetical protein
LTRDISLVDAVLDLVDDSINSAIIRSKSDLTQPSDYIALLAKRPRKALPFIAITFSGSDFGIADTCGGIAFKDAEATCLGSGVKRLMKNQGIA